MLVVWSGAGSLLNMCPNPLQSSLGALGAMVLPPTSVLPVQPGGGRGPSNGGESAGPGPHRTGVGTDLAADSSHSTHLVHGADDGAHHGPGSVDGDSGVPGAAGGATAPAGGGGGGTSRSRKKQLARALRQAQRWYRSHAGVWHLTAPADAGAPDRWRNFRIGMLPPGCKPILVCINPRSGPQVCGYAGVRAGMLPLEYRLYNEMQHTTSAAVPLCGTCSEGVVVPRASRPQFTWACLPACLPALCSLCVPQVGEQLRRQLLQLLHPLQVVDLSRELPGPALRCWWGVPGLRVLAVGGDGTVSGGGAWVGGRGQRDILMTYA